MEPNNVGEFIANLFLFLLFHIGPITNKSIWKVRIIYQIMIVLTRSYDPCFSFTFWTDYRIPSYNIKNICDNSFPFRTPLSTCRLDINNILTATLFANALPIFVLLWSLILLHLWVSGSLFNFLQCVKLTFIITFFRTQVFVYCTEELVLTY